MSEFSVTVNFEAADRQVAEQLAERILQHVVEQWRDGLDLRGIGPAVTIHDHLEKTTVERHHVPEGATGLFYLHFNVFGSHQWSFHGTAETAGEWVAEMLRRRLIVSPPGEQWHHSFEAHELILREP